MYLNKAEFIYDAYGIKSAAKTFFNSSTDTLKIEQAAVIIGMLKNPSRITSYNVCYTKLLRMHTPIQPH